MKSIKTNPNSAKGPDKGKIVNKLYCILVDTEMCCPKGKCGCQYFILLTLKKEIHGHRFLDFFLIKK
jgi:hypothetical protein